MRLLRIRTDQFLESMMESARAADIAPFLASVHAFAEAEPLLAVSHLTRRDFAFLPVDIPSRCRCHGEL